MRPTTLALAALLALPLAPAITPASAAEEPATVTALYEAPVGLARAVEAAERLGGGRAAEAVFDEEDEGGPSYEVTVASGDKLLALRIDARTGEERGREELTLRSYFTTLTPETLAAAPASLAAAVAAAEAAAEGKAVEAGADPEQGTVIYDVIVVRRDGKTFEVTVGADGKVGEVEAETED